MASSKSNFIAVNPLHHNFKDSNLEMTEISIQESNNDRKDHSARPATLTISSPFGPPGLTSVSISNADNKHNLDEHINQVNNSNISMNLTKNTSIGILLPISHFVTIIIKHIFFFFFSLLDAIKEWSMITYKCTKQLVNEKLGKWQRTVDGPLEAEIEYLRETQKKYNQMLRIAREMTVMYFSLVRHQISLYESLSDLALREARSNENSNPDLEDDSSLKILDLSSEMRQNADMLRHVAKNGEKLVNALQFFCSNLSTLVTKTIEDTIITIRNYEQARLEYDAERNSLASLLPAKATSAANTEKLISTRARYEKLKEDVGVKMKFLDENKVKVMHKQMILFHNAFTAYAAGNSSLLDSALKQFSIKLTQQSFLEK